MPSENSSLLPTQKSQSPALNDSQPDLSILHLLTILSFSFSSGSLLSTYFLLILPIESAKLSSDLKPIILGCFISLAGLTQLICPIIGLISDRSTLKMGRRRPFMLIGGVVGTVGLVMQKWASYNDIARNWHYYTIGYSIAMCSLNLVFSSMIGLIPDKIPTRQLGKANGIQAFLCVGGSLCGFAYFFFYLDERVEGMYNFFIAVMIITVSMTVVFIDEEDPLNLSSDRENDSHKDDENGNNSDGWNENGNNSDGWNDRNRSLIPALEYREIKSAYYLSPSNPAQHDFFYVTLSRGFYYMGISAQTFFLYYLKDIIRYPDPQRGTALLAAVAQFCASLSCYPIGIVIDAVMSSPTFKTTPHRLQPMKHLVYVACGLLAAGEMSLVFVRDMDSVIFICCATGIANGAYLTLDSSLAVDTLPDKRESAKYLGIWGVAVFVGTAAGPVITGPLLYLFGDDGTGRGVYTITGYAVLLGISSFYFVLSGASLYKVKATV